MGEKKTDEKCPLCNGCGKFSYQHRELKIIVMKIMREFGISRRTAFRWIKKSK
jgi:hypothetical protein